MHYITSDQQWDTLSREFPHLKGFKKPNFKSGKVKIEVHIRKDDTVVPMWIRKLDRTAIALFDKATKSLHVEKSVVHYNFVDHVAGLHYEAVHRAGEPNSIDAFVDGTALKHGLVCVSCTPTEKYLVIIKKFDLDRFIDANQEMLDAIDEIEGFRPK